MTGKEIVKLMRVNKVTIRELAKRMNITLIRIRFVRDNGIKCPLAKRDWIQGITGNDPGVQS